MSVFRSRAPLRLGLAGGGSDVSPYCDTFGGAVLNITIDRYASATLERRADGRIVFVSTDLDQREEMNSAAKLDLKEGLRLHRGVYNRMIEDFNHGQALSFVLTTHVESPMGSGLGSSSALVVAMVQVFAEVLKVPLGEYEVAHLAFQIERQDLGLAGGRQDHYAAAFGGCNYLEFGANDRVVVNPLRIKPEILCELEESLVVVFTGASRQSDVIISKQAHAVADGGKSLEAMHNLKKEAVAMKEALLFGKIDGMAQILQRGWEAKKATSDSVSTPLIESLFQAALGAGALAGKVSGAGGGGFIMFLVEPRRKAEVMRAMQSNGFAAQCPRFTPVGSISWCPKRVE